MNSACRQITYFMDYSTRLCMKDFFFLREKVHTTLTVYCLYHSEDISLQKNIQKVQTRSNFSVNLLLFFIVSIHI